MLCGFIARRVVVRGRLGFVARGVLRRRFDFRDGLKRCLLFGRFIEHGFEKIDRCHFGRRGGLIGDLCGCLRGRFSQSRFRRYSFRRVFDKAIAHRLRLLGREHHRDRLRHRLGHDHGVDQCDQRGLRSAADAMNRDSAGLHLQDRLSVTQRAGARVVETGPGQIVEQSGEIFRTIIGAGERAVRREGHRRHRDAVDQMREPLGERHRTSDRIGGGDENPRACVGEGEPCAMSMSAGGRAARRNRAAVRAALRPMVTAVLQAVRPGGGAGRQGRWFFRRGRRRCVRRTAALRRCWPRECVRRRATRSTQAGCLSREPQGADRGCPWSWKSASLMLDNGPCVSLSWRRILAREMGSNSLNK